MPPFARTTSLFTAELGLPVSRSFVIDTFNFARQTANDREDGVSREVYLINNQQPGPLIEADEGDDVEVFVKNDLPVETTIHWHGKSTCSRRVRKVDANEN
jgi:FtsP/CotA-like multicopper oxidase with cupredoxin domain